MHITMSMLQQASQTVVDMDDDDLVDYLHQLQEGIFEAYTGVLQGLRADSKADAFVPYIEQCLQLLILVAKVKEAGKSQRDATKQVAQWASTAAFQGGM